MDGWKPSADHNTRDSPGEGLGSLYISGYVRLLARLRVNRGRFLRYLGREDGRMLPMKRPRFSLRLLLIVFTLICVTTGFVTYRLRSNRRQQALDRRLIVACYHLDAASVVKCLCEGAAVNGTLGESATEDSALMDPWDGGTYDSSGRFTPLMAVASASEYPDPPAKYSRIWEHPDLVRKVEQETSAEALQQRRATERTILLILLSHSPNVDLDDGNGATALYLAADQSKPLLVRELLNHGANPNTRTHRYIDGPDNITPLHAATRCPEAYQLLLDHGADPSAKDSEGKTPADYAVMRGVADVIVTVFGAPGSKPIPAASGGESATEVFGTR